MGSLFSLIDQNLPLVGAEWSTNQIPDVDGQVIIVTGANSGEETFSMLKRRRLTL